MANNETFYRLAREALEDDCTICMLIIDLNLAVESYLQQATEEPVDALGREHRVREEVEHGLIHLARFERDLHGWKELTEPKDPYPGIFWPVKSDSQDPPDGWSWVERLDEADLYESDWDAAQALIEKHGVPATEVRWFDRYTHEPLDDYRTGASVAINVPEPEEGIS